jgi:hypothetical protein
VSAGASSPWPRGADSARRRADAAGSFHGHFPVARHLIALETATGLDLHIEVGGRLVLYRAHNQPLDEASFEKLRRRSVREFWVPADQSGAYGRYLIENAAPLLAGVETDEEAAAIVRDVSRGTLRELFDRLDDASSFERVERASALTVDRVAADVAFMPRLLEFVGDREALLARATNTAAYAIALGARQPDVSSAQLYEVGLGALLHDVGLAPLGTALDAGRALTDVEQHMAIRHARRGFEALTRAGIGRATVLRIVRDHHGTDSGSLPSLAVQIVALADQFDELTNQHGGPAVGPFAALYQMRANTGQVFSTELLRDFVLMLGGVPALGPHSPVAAVSRQTAGGTDRRRTERPRYAERERAED